MIFKLLLSLFLFQFTIPFHTGAPVSPPPVGAPAWDTNSASLCNPSFPNPSNTFSCTITTGASELVLFGYTSGNVVYSSVTIDGVTPTTIVNQALAGSFGYQGLFYQYVSSGSHTITLNYGTNVTPPSFYARSITGANASSPIDGVSSAVFTVGTGVSFSCPAFTTTGANDLIVAFGSTSSTTNLTAGSGYTLYPGVTTASGNYGGSYESLSSTSAGSYSPSFINGNGGHQGCIGFGVKS